MSRKIAGWVFTVGLMLTQDAGAVDVDRLFGHDITITGEDPDRSLNLDGRSVVKDAIISLSQVIMIAGVPTLIGERSAGGNACDASPFIISFPAGSAPRIDGPIDACASITMLAMPDHLEFQTKPIAGQSGEHWSWSPTTGLKQLSAVAFTADSAKGWDDLRERKLQHPADIFEYGEIARKLNALLGPDAASFTEIITGVGGGAFKGDDYVGTSCMRHMCDSTGALVYLATGQQDVYVAWKAEGHKIVVRPPVKQWPDKPRQELRSWAQQWKSE